MRFKIASVQGEDGEQGVTLVTLTVLTQDKVILHLPYSSLLKGNTLYSQYRALNSCPQWVIKTLSLSEKQDGSFVSLSSSLPTPQHSEREMTLLCYSVTVGIPLKDNFLNIIYLLTQSTHQNIGYSDARALSPSCSEIPRKVKCQDSMGHRGSAGSAHVPASNTKCFPALIFTTGATKSHVFEIVLPQPELFSHSPWIHFPQWTMKAQNLQTTIWQIFNTLKAFLKLYVTLNVNVGLDLLPPNPCES